MLSQWQRAQYLVNRTVHSCDDTRHVTAAPTRVQMILWIVLLVLSLIFSLSQFHSFQFGAFVDDADYAILADSLVRSDRYGLDYGPGEFGPPRYPVGYPLVLAPLAALFPDNIDMLKATSLVATLLNATILFWAWPRFSRRSYWWGLVVAGLYALSPIVIRQTGMVLSEPIFTTLALLAIILTEHGGRSRTGYWWSLGLSVTLLSLVLIRTIGGVFLLASFIYLLRVHGRRFWRQLRLVVAQMALLTGLIVVLTPVQVVNLLPAQYVNDYLSMFGSQGEATVPAAPAENPDRTPIDTPAEAIDAVESEVIETPVLRRIVQYAETAGLPVPSHGHYLLETAEAGEMHLEIHFREAAFPIVSGAYWRDIGSSIGIRVLPNMFGLFVCALIALGYIHWYRQEGLTPFFLFGALYLPLLFVWLWRDTRFLHPVQPQLSFSMLIGVEVVLYWIARGARRAEALRSVQRGVIAGLVAALLVSGAVQSRTAIDSRAHVGDLERRTTWLRQQSDPSAIVLSEAAEVDHLYSGRRMVRYAARRDPPAEHSFVPPPGSAAELEMDLIDFRIDYILIAPSIAWQPDYSPFYSSAMQLLIPQVESLERQGKVMLVYGDDDTRIRIYRYSPQR